MDSLGRIDVKGTGIKTEVNKMMAMGIIEPSKSPFCCPLLIIKKADGYLKQMNELIVYSSLRDEHMNSLKKFQSLQECVAYGKTVDVPRRLHSGKFCRKQSQVGVARPM